MNMKKGIGFRTNAFLCMYAGHGINLGGESPLWGRSSQSPTTSQSTGCPS